MQTPARTTDVHDEVMHLLEDHVPLALLCDLTTADAPDSKEILDAEGVPVDEWWVR